MSIESKCTIGAIASKKASASSPVAARIASGSVNRLAFMIAGALVIVMALAGVAANDPYDGLLRGVLEAGAFLGGYAVLGRYLAIRR